MNRMSKRCRDCDHFRPENAHPCAFTQLDPEHPVSGDDVADELPCFLPREDDGKVPPSREHEPVVWNPRYAAYAYPLHPNERLRLDDERWPGGCMCGYIGWNQERWLEFYKLRGVTNRDPITATPAFHQEFDAWLWQQVGVADPVAYMRSVNEVET